MMVNILLTIEEKEVKEPQEMRTEDRYKNSLQCHDYSLNNY